MGSSRRGMGYRIRDFSSTGKARGFQNASPIKIMGEMSVENQPENGLKDECYPLWNIAEVCCYLQVKRQTVYNWVTAGKIPHCKAGRLLRFDPQAIQQWCRAGERIGGLNNQLELCKLTPTTSTHPEGRR